MNEGMEANDVNVILNMSVLGTIIEKSQTSCQEVKKCRPVDKLDMNETVFNPPVVSKGQQLDHQETLLKKILEPLQLLGIFQILQNKYNSFAKINPKE